MKKSWDETRRKISADYFVACQKVNQFSGFFYSNMSHKKEHPNKSLQGLLSHGTCELQLSGY